MACGPGPCYVLAMARLARVVVPGLPHHVTQRGNRRETVFFNDDDYRAYIDLLSASVAAADCRVWAWCLMPNHVHIIIVPDDEDGLRRALAPAHRRYAMRINARTKWTGHLWQGRYGAVAMDEDHLMHAIAYVSNNPVRAGLVKRAEDWPWSSVHAHLAGRDDQLTSVAPVLERVGDFAAFVAQPREDDGFAGLRRAETIGRPLGSAGFLAGLETRLGRRLAAKPRGRPRRQSN